MRERARPPGNGLGGGGGCHTIAPALLGFIERLIRPLDEAFDGIAGQRFGHADGNSDPADWLGLTGTMDLAARDGHSNLLRLQSLRDDVFNTAVGNEPHGGDPDVERKRDAFAHERQRNRDGVENQ